VQWLLRAIAPPVHFSLKVVKHGGVLRTRKVATIADAAGLSLFGGTMLESSTGTAASAQLFSTISRLDWGCQLLAPELFSDGLTVEQLVYQDFTLSSRPDLASA
jgi:muconate cycloisomerase